MDDIDKQIETIKISRYKPIEKFIYDILINSNKCFIQGYPDSTFYIKNNKVLCEYNSHNNIFYYNIDIYNVLSGQHKIHFIDIESIIIRMLRYHLKINNCYSFSCTSKFNSFYFKMYNIKNRG